MKLKIGNREYEIIPSYGKFEKLFKKYPLDKHEELTAEQNMEYIIDAIWLFLKKRWYGLRPFITKSIMKNVITIPELNKIGADLPTWITGEDRETKNLDTSESSISSKE